MNLSEIDRQLILATQSGLPLTKEPYQQIANELGMTAKEVISRLDKMLKSGIIRRIAADPNHYALDFKANAMTVWDVPDECVVQLGEKLGQQVAVSHCYQRPRALPDWPYNLFAMVHGKTRDEVFEKVEKISDLLDDADQGHEVLFSTKILKKTGLRIKGS